MRHATRLALTAMLALAIADVPATAAPTWLPPTPLDGNHDNAVSAAMNANGDTILGLRDTSQGAPYLASAGFRPAGGPTTAVTAVAPAAAGSNSDQDVAINSRGDAVLVWTDAMSIWLAMRPAGNAGFSSPISIAPSSAGSVQVAIDDAGAVVMAWTAPLGGKQLVFFTVRNPDGTLGPISSSAAGQDATSPTVAAARDGHAVVAWSRNDGAHNVIQAATRAPGTTSFVPTGDLSDSAQSADSADAAIADGGHAAITWSRTDGTHTIVQVARRQGEGLFSTGHGLSPTTVDSHHPSVAINTTGQVLVSWSTDVWEADARVGSATGDFGPRQVFSTYGGGKTDAALNDDGMGLVTWVGVSNATCVECANSWASVMPPGGTFGTPIKISPVGAASVAVENVQGAGAGIDAEGNAVAYTRARGNGVHHMYERLYDGAGPRLGGLSVPTATTAGMSATFAVAPFDVISAVASTSWSFGDGSVAASGTSVQHTFAAAGSYDVTVTSTDAVGITSSATRKVTVAAAATLPGTPQIPMGPSPLLPKATPRCKVPSLKNLSVARAKPKLVKANCKLGKVTTPRKLKNKKGLVIRSQSRATGTSTINGTKVNVTLGTKPKPKKKVRGR